MAPTRWGIASCGKISFDFSTALQHLGSDKHVIVAVAARSESSAAEFAKKFGVSKYYGSYEKLGQDPEVDVIYIGSINTTHLALGKMYLNANKPIICEKPLCVDVKETNELIALAKERNVFLMEAIWSRCNPVYRELKARLDRKEVGEVVHAHATFGVPIEKVARIERKELGGGCTPDIGIYVLNFLLIVMGDEMPVDIKTSGKINENGVETEVTGVMTFSNNRFASFTISASCKLPNEAYVSGVKGTIKLSCPFWCPTELTGPSGDFSCPLDPTDKVYNFDNSQLLKHEAVEVAKCLEKGHKESSLVPHSLSKKLAELVQRIRTDVGVEY